MKISQKQLDQMLAEQDLDLAHQAYYHLNKLLPQELEKIKKDDFFSLVNKQIDNAKKYGIMDGTGQIRYIIISFIFGEDFDTEFSLFNDILKNWELEVPDKIEFLMKASMSIFEQMDES